MKIERLVRVLLGLPVAVSYLYLRHFSLFWARSALALGLLMILAAMIPSQRHTDHRSPVMPHFSFLEDFFGFVLLLITFVPLGLYWQTRRVMIGWAERFRH